MVVIGAGATGLPAAIKAVDEGASVIVVEANYDVGGHAILSGDNVPLGGGTSAQRKYSVEDSPDIIFADLTEVASWPPWRSVTAMLQLEEQARMNYYAYCAMGREHPSIPEE